MLENQIRDCIKAIFFSIEKVNLLCTAWRTAEVVWTAVKSPNQKILQGVAIHVPSRYYHFSKLCPCTVAADDAHNVEVTALPKE